jgi:hypothetical protein
MTVDSVHIQLLLRPPQALYSIKRGTEKVKIIGRQRLPELGLFAHIDFLFPRHIMDIWH